MFYLNTGIHTVKKISNFGKNIVLDDNSPWEVTLLDKIKSMSLLPGDKVTVKSYVGTKYQIEHRNLSGKIDVIEAIYLGKK